MAGNMFYFDAFSYYSLAINASFAHVRAYAIRPYIYSIIIKWKYPKQNI